LLASLRIYNVWFYKLSILLNSHVAKWLFFFFVTPKKSGLAVQRHISVYLISCCSFIGLKHGCSLHVGIQTRPVQRYACKADILTSQTQPRLQLEHVHTHLTKVSYVTLLYLAISESRYTIISACSLGLCKTYCYEYADSAFTSLFHHKSYRVIAHSAGCNFAQSLLSRLS